MIFLGLGTSSLFAAGLGSLVLLTFLAGLIKVALNKRDLKKKIKLANLEAANKQTDREKLVGERELDEGDLFGVRAIQAGFFGGVTQSCPNSPVPSRSSSVASQDAISSASISHKPKPTPLLLEPPKPGLYKSVSGRTSSTSSQSSIPSTDGNFSNSAESSNGSTSSVNSKSDWEQISPNGRRIDLLGLKINSNPEKSALIVPMSPEPALKSASASIVSFEDSTSSARYPVYSHEEGLSRGQVPYANPCTPNSKPPLFRTSSESTLKVAQKDALSNVSVSLANLPSQISPPAIIRDSVVSKQQASISHANLKSRHIPTEKRKISDATSSIYSARTSEIESVLDHPIGTNVSSLQMNRHFRPQNHINSRSSSLNSKNMLDHTINMDGRGDQNSQRFSPASQQGEFSILRDSSTSNNYSTSHSTKSSLSSVSCTEKLPRSTDSGLSAFALQNFDFPSQRGSPTQSQRSRNSRSSIDDFYDVYYRQTLLRQSVL